MASFISKNAPNQIIWVGDHQLFSHSYLLEFRKQLSLHQIEIELWNPHQANFSNPFLILCQPSSHNEEKILNDLHQIQKRYPSLVLIFWLYPQGDISSHFILAAFREFQVRTIFDSTSHWLDLISEIKVCQMSTQNSSWEETFDRMKIPIAIKESRTHETLLANKKYVEWEQSISSSLKWNSISHDPFNYLRFKDNNKDNNKDKIFKQKIIQSKCETIYEDGTKGNHTINYYLDVTQEIESEVLIYQEEKKEQQVLLAQEFSHSLIQPLTEILQTSQKWIQEVDVRPEYRRYLLEIETATHRALGVIQTLMEFSQGKDIRQKISLNEVVQKTLPFLKKVTYPFLLEINLASDETTGVYVNFQLVQQVLFNLIVNATQAMGNSGCLSLTTKQGEEEGKIFVDLSVKDTGPGIPFENQEVIFEPFFSTKSAEIGLGSGLGLGLGLAISKQIMIQQGGKILLSSAPEKGSEFILRLPYVQLNQN